MNLTNCGYIDENKGTHMWLSSFYLTVDNRVDNIFTFKSMRRPYSIIKIDYNQPRHKAATNTSLPTTTPTLISKYDNIIDASVTDILAQ